DFSVRPFPIEVKQGRESEISYEVAPLECRGYAVRYVKTLSLNGATLSLRHVIENVGTKEIATHEYNHNFFRVNGHAFGPDYVLGLSFDPFFDTVPRHLAPRDVPDVLNLDQGEVHW